MHNLAIALHKKKYIVSGSDDEIFEPSRSRLLKHGLLPKKTGWNPESITPEIDAVIAGMHARADNPELLRAHESGIRVYSYPEFLYEHSLKKTRVVIGGSHGKTTITAMILHVLKQCNIDTDYMVGAQLEGFDVMVRLTDDASLMVMEGDEYPSAPTDPRPKFHVYRPHIAVISGIAWDHMNVFKTPRIYFEQFKKFIDLIEDKGVLVYAGNDSTVSELLSKEINPTLKLVPYQLPEYEVKQGTTYVKNGGNNYRLKFFGKHNLLNMNAARFVLRELGVTDSMFFNAITSFKGASNRLQLLHDEDSVTVIRDFAHAPSKVKATLEAVREKYPGRKIIACLELHTYSSLSRDFLDQYRGSLDIADNAFVYYSSAAIRLKRLSMIGPVDIRQGFGNDDIMVFSDRDDFKSALLNTKGNNTCFLFMSSGDFGGLDIKHFAGHAMRAR